MKSEVAFSSREGLKVFARGDILFALGMLALMAVLIIPMPKVLMDICLALSLLLSLLIFITVLFIRNPLEFTTFPTVILISTLIRLSLNVASTRLILTRGHEGTAAAGKVIEAFGNFVMGGNFLIGFVIFVILVLINFVVITKGSGRMAEVSARFSLDGMPGKQMAIDADLSAGLINEETARARRRTLESESNFYGSMDGVAKFVRGDATAGLLITMINVIGGIVIGTVQKGLSFAQASQTYTLLTVGDGLVTQIPALIVSTAAGLLISKSGQQEATDAALTRQLGSYPAAYGLCGGLAMLFALIPGLPFLPFCILGGLCAVAADRTAKRLMKERQEEQAKADAANNVVSTPASAPVSAVAPVDAVRLDLGVGLIGLMSPRRTVRLSDQIRALREQIGRDLGIILPPIRIQDNAALPAEDYRICLRETPLTQGTVRNGQFLILNPGGDAIALPGENAKEPAFGLPALWVSAAYKTEAVRKGYTVVDDSTVLLTHLGEVLREHAAELLTYAHMQELFAELPEIYRKLVGEIVPAQLPAASMQRILQNLLAERVSVRDLPSVIEAVADALSHTRHVLRISEHVRMRLGRQIVSRYLDDSGYMSVLSLSAEWESRLEEALIGDPAGGQESFVLPPEHTRNLTQALCRHADQAVIEGHVPVILAGAAVRPYVRMLLYPLRPSVAVLSHDEVPAKTNIRVIGRVL